MSTITVKSSASFEPGAYRKSIADMFGVLAPDQQREFVDRLAVLPVHIHRLASDGMIADRTVREPRHARGKVGLAD
jgi:hypothetical protein